MLAVKNRREIWRHPNPEEAIGKKLWDAPTLQNYPQHIETMKKGIARAAKGHIFTTEVRMERDGMPGGVVRVGVRRREGRMEAHAWVDFAGEILGDHEENVGTFAELSDLQVVRRP